MPKTATSTAGAKLIEKAVIRREATRRARLLDKAFALAFKGLVYAQIWEDPVATWKRCGSGRTAA